MTVLASTFLTGAVDTAIFALIGDVVVSPLLVMVLLGERRDRLRSLPFPLGLTLAMTGASLTTSEDNRSRASRVGGLCWPRSSP